MFLFGDFGEAVVFRGVQIAIRAQNHVGTLQLTCSGGSPRRGWFFFSYKIIQLCGVFFRWDFKDLGSKNNMPDGVKVPVRELLVSIPAVALLYNLGPGYFPLLALRFSLL